jgi:peptidoglycan/LPS O-acetylase OafA/YrhL
MPRPEIPSLTGLRFYAAALVLWAHTVGGFLIPADVPILQHTFTVGQLGMTLFFVLSGFVIHYNYVPSLSKPTAWGIYSFAVARFARLYPLFLLCVIITVAMGREPVSSFAETWTFYLTMTHDWFPRVVGGILMGDLFAPASWSISAEVFLYLLYVPLARPLHRLLKSERTILGTIGTLSAIVTVFYLFRLAGSWASGNDYWLFYRSPFCRVSEFALGALIAALYNVRSSRPVTVRERRLTATLAAVGATWAVALLAASVVPAIQDQATMLQQSWGLAPSAAALIYYLARCRSPLSWFVENKATILLGEASYSIYLLHWVFFWVFTSSGVAANVLLGPKVALTWLMTCLLSLGCYQYFEGPARVFIRRAMAPRKRLASSALAAE